MKTNEIKRYFLECVINYDGENFSSEERAVRFLDSVFRDEKSLEIHRIGERRAFIDWIWGLPVVFAMPLYDEDIEKLFEEWGVPPTDEPAQKFGELMYGVYRELKDKYIYNK